MLLPILPTCCRSFLIEGCVSVIIVKARQARLDRAQQEGHDVRIADVATALRISRAALHAIEAGGCSLRVLLRSVWRC